MALSGIGGATPSEEPKKVGGNDRLDENELKNQNKPNVSIWDNDGNGTVSVEEQRQAVETAISENKEIQEAIKLGFKVPSFDFKEIVTGVADKVTDSAMKEKVEEAIKQANKSVQGYIDTVKDKAQVFTKMYNTLKSLGDKALKGIKNFKLGDKAEPQGDNNYSINYSDYLRSHSNVNL